MCGRFSIDITQKETEEYFDATFTEDFKPRYNAAPSQDLPVILDEDPSLIQFINWGLHPRWFKFQKDLINFKAETMVAKPFMRRYLSKRCLIPATGFFEWKSTGYHKTPYSVHLKDRSLFSFAGVWEQEKDRFGNPKRSFSIITTTPNILLENINSRMPVILSREMEKNWLLRDLPVEYALQLLSPYPADKMTAFEVSTIVNSPNNDAPQILRPV